MSLAGNGEQAATLPAPDGFADADESFFADDTLPTSSQTAVNSKDDNDGFEDYDLSFEFTSKELDWVDVTTRVRGNLGGANYLHQIEESGAPEPLADGQLAKSPYDTFRAYKGYLTVSDIAGPSWCEFQKAYDFLAARNEKNKDKSPEEEPSRKKRRLEKEPEKGTQTKLDDWDKSSSASSSTTAAFLKRHQFKPLEEPEPLTVEEIPAYSTEDEAARRLVKEILCMDRLSTYGTCNGMDVFGMINGFVVAGKPDGVTQVIENQIPARGPSGYPTPPPSRFNTPADDEIKLEHFKEEPRDVEFVDIGSIKYKPTSSQAKLQRANTPVKLEPSSPKRPLRKVQVKLEPDDVKLELDDIKVVFGDVKLESGDVKPEPDDINYDVDRSGEAPRTVLTIWKRKPYPETYIPSNSNELTTCLMLMCYYKLLVDLFSPDYSFKPIWEKLDVDGDRPLTLQFVKHADQWIRLDDTRTLNDLADEFFRRRAQVQNLFIDPALRISYEPSKTSRRTRSDFVYNYSEDILEPYLDSILKWWRGERPAKGVPPENARWKCRKCRHSETCWWRRTDGGTRPLPEW
ncbi:hypothetical protein PENSPDRAFT_659386 [Peniophora sp. CONT]|nr:hypothetical protein PENSPDRAFT_659386 [Peniophora sp. CONT]